jgi:glutathione peroxidase
MFAKIVVRGSGQNPLYRFLTSKATNPKFSGEVGWNFEKFLIGRNGEVVGRFESPIEPLSAEMIRAIESALAQK